MSEPAAAAITPDVPVIARGQARSPEAAMTLATYERRTRLALILSAVLPLLIVPQPGNVVSIVVGVVSWLVFLADYIVHRRYLVNYLGTRIGKFDLVVVILTAPWFLLPGASNGAIVVVLRLARLVRLVAASKGARRLAERLGRVVVVALGVVMLGAAMAYFAEHPTNPEFANYGDSLWWAVVTLTTVGYGDIVPITTPGRVTAVMIMVTGVAVLGVLAGTLASFFGGPQNGTETTADPQSAPTEDPSYARLADEVAMLRTQIAVMASTWPGGRGSSPGTPQDSTSP